MLNVLGDSGVLLVAVKRHQHSGNANVTHSTTHMFFVTPSEITQMGETLTRVVEGLSLILYVHDG